MACRKRGVREPGRSRRFLAVGSLNVRYTATEARQGKPGHGVRRKPKRAGGTPEQAGGEVLSKGKPAGCRWGVLSGIVL
jgi:hypothetical protein